MLSLTRTRFLATQIARPRLASARVVRLHLTQRHVVQLAPAEILRFPTDRLAFSTLMKRNRGRKVAGDLNNHHFWKFLNKLIKDKPSKHSHYQVGWKLVIIVWLIALPIGAAVWLVCAIKPTDMFLLNQCRDRYTLAGLR
ncbi:hypothetical protein BDZ45DRAFT_410442 [Acephala macrosclerotiorum]|nr:hypothetical protein BDZ45DRAFT_410442 [Acephala macrosclerotiorum]